MIVNSHDILETPHCLRCAEADLLGETGGAAVLWTGRAATSLYLAYRMAALRAPALAQPEVIVPAMCCATPANVAYVAGFRPRFADVDPNTGLLTLESVQARRTDQTLAVVFVQLFGQTADLEPIAAWCRSRGIALIEDIAQAQGARLPDGRPAGSVGDMAVYSFNPTKILECGGGALTVRSTDELLAAAQELAAHPLFNSASSDTESQLGVSYRNLHHGLAALLRLRPECRIADVFMRVRGEYDGLYLRPMRTADALAAAWQELNPKLECRYRNAETYAQILSGGPWQLLCGWRTSGVCWRFSLLVNFPNCVVPFCESVRRDGFHVSNLYWPLHQFFNPDDDCPASVDFARRVVNLWVDSGISHAYAHGCGESLWKHAEHMDLKHSSCKKE